MKDEVFGEGAGKIEAMGLGCPVTGEGCVVGDTEVWVWGVEGFPSRVSRRGESLSGGRAGGVLVGGVVGGWMELGVQSRTCAVH
jgi:hypothetical protein